MLTQLGPYPIEREIGRGGMGVVYLGRDPRLDRPVAIKVLPEPFASDPERLSRFEREARLLASLNHPNVAGIYGLEVAEGRRFLALEYVEGRTLAEALARGPLPVDETLDVCGQIAAALEAAHEAGIIHRDLKPGNVKLTPGGAVKVLDFGLARGPAATADSSPDLSHSPTLTASPTAAGVILGTAAYMSPEQARGKSVDRRTDIWSFGCVIYECLTGQQAFAGETVSDMIALILQGQPDWSKLPAATPERLRVLLGRCLEKDARRRLRDIGDARLEIDELRGATGASGAGRASAAAGSAAAARPTDRPAWAPVARAALLLVAGAAAGIGAWTIAGLSLRSEPALRFSVEAPPGRDLDLDPNQHVISPDGRTMVLSLIDSTGQSNLWIRPLAGFEARPLEGTRNAVMPFWSPDSRQIGFFADGKLKRIRVSGGNAEIVCEAAGGRGASWGSRDEIVFAPGVTGPLMSVRSSGGTPVTVTVVDTAHGETAHRWPSFLPDGRHFTYAAVPTRSGGFSCFVGSTRGTLHRPLVTANTAPIYAAPGYLIFSRNEALLAQRFDLRRLRFEGDPVTLGEPPSAQTILTASPCASVSANGVLAWIRAGKLDTHLEWMDRAGRIVGSVDAPADRWGAATLSPDGRYAAVEQDVASGNTDLWTVDLERGTANRLTYGEGKNTGAVWSPDGRELLYSSTREGIRNVFRRAADGSGSDRPFYRSGASFKDAAAWSPDGRTVLITQMAEDHWSVLRMPADGGTTVPLLDSRFNELNPQISPDGAWVLYQSDESGSQQAYVQSFPGLGRKQQVTKTGTLFAWWTKGGREIVILRPDFGIVSVPIRLGPELKIGSPEELCRVPANARSGWPTPDGQRFLVTVPAVQTVAGVSIAVNWRASLAP